MRAIVEGMEAKLPAGAWPVYTGSNHDAGRLATRWAGDDPRRARAALLMLLTLRGTPFLYYGDELGLPEVATDWRTALDPVARRTGDPSRNRDVLPHADAVERTRRAAASRRRRRAPWLPFGDLAVNVAAQRDDPGSTLHLVRDLIALRRATRGSARGRATRRCRRPTARGRGGAATGIAVAVNLSGAAWSVDGLAGRVAIGDRSRPRRRGRGRLARARAVGGCRGGAGR